jgi:rRNA maturation protein Nop10
MKQLVLPGFDMRQICPACGKPSNVLAQWSPWSKWWICHECSERYPFPVEIITARIKDGIERLSIAPDASSELRELRVHNENILAEMISAQARRARYFAHLAGGWIPADRQAQYGRWLHRARLNNCAYTLSMPICKRCGCAHNWWIGSDFSEFCQNCHDLNDVDALWRCRAIFGSDDDESALDRLYQAHPGLFERGVLPDRWFELMRGVAVKERTLR